MLEMYSDCLKRIEAFMERYDLVRKEELGYGVDGIVYSTPDQSAVKSFRHLGHYQKERDVYLRLQENDIQKIEGFNIPQLVRHDDELWVIEMEIVQPPFVLDFAGAYLDERPPFTEEQWAEWEADKRELFEDKWPQVQSVMASFRRYGVYLNDVKYGNIEFEPEE